MRYLLDTDICIYILNERDEGLLDRFRSVRPADVGISAITVAELSYGADRSSHPKKNRERITAFLGPITVLSFDDVAGKAYGEIRSDLEKRGALIGLMDMLIAASSISRGLTLVTNNTAEFRRVRSLKLENWMKRT